MTAASHPFIETFAAAWEDATLDALMAPLADSVTLIQPLSPPLVGKHAARRAFAKILHQYPGLHGRAVSGFGDDDRALISWTMCVPVGRRLLEIPVVDDFEFSDAKVVKRTAYFDPGPILRAVVITPAVWLRQLRSHLKSFEE